MESQPQNPEFGNNTENFHPCTYEPTNEILVLVCICDPSTEFRAI